VLRRGTDVGTREWILTAAVIVVPLLIAMVVTFWSLEQARYRRKKWHPPVDRQEYAEAGQPASSKQKLDQI
jgi:hypothetical protein